MNEGQCKNWERKETGEVLSRTEEKKWQVMHKIRGPAPTLVNLEAEYEELEFYLGPDVNTLCYDHFCKKK